MKMNRTYKRKIRLAEKYQDRIELACWLCPNEIESLRAEYLRKRKRIERQLIVVEPEEEAYFLGMF